MWLDAKWRILTNWQKRSFRVKFQIDTSPRHDLVVQDFSFFTIRSRCRIFRYSYEDFFKVFGKGEEDQATIESWEASSKNIKNTGALLYPAGNQDLLPHINIV